jgi:hypothetical protein
MDLLLILFGGNGRSSTREVGGYRRRKGASRGASVAGRSHGMVGGTCDRRV